MIRKPAQRPKSILVRYLDEWWARSDALFLMLVVAIDVASLLALISISVTKVG